MNNVNLVDFSNAFKKVLDDADFKDMIAMDMGSHIGYGEDGKFEIRGFTFINQPWVGKKAKKEGERR